MEGVKMSDSDVVHACSGMELVLGWFDGLPIWWTQVDQSKTKRAVAVPNGTQLCLSEGFFHLLNPQNWETWRGANLYAVVRKDGLYLPSVYKELGWANCPRGLRATVLVVGEPAPKKKARKYFILNGHQLPC